MAEHNEQIKVESRLLAALAHGSIILQGMGMLVGVLVYVTQREKARFAAFQALQAAVYQLIVMIATIVVWTLWGVCYALSFIPMIGLPEDAPPPPIFWVGLGSMVIPFAAMAIFGLYGLWAALRVWQGHDFRYVLIGAWLERSGLWKNVAA